MSFLSRQFKLSESIELYMINRTVVVVIATAAHKALVSPVRLPRLLGSRSLRQSQIYQESMTIL
jgi:hypothetical protein